jgi:Flp pilus assembly protein TadD
MILAAVLSLLLIPASGAALATPTPGVATAASSPDHVGSTVCGSCHEAELKLWKGSDHERAMQVPKEATVLGDFTDARFLHDSVTSTFSRDGARFVVDTQGPDGKQHRYALAYTFGVKPLQQYLLAFPGGAYQALTVAWDSRPKQQGGQRWFDLYPDDKTPPGDVLHWTGPAHTWNRMCADCHSTDLQSQYDVAKRRYATQWSEVSVGCESCHGPGREHVAWARNPASVVVGASRGLAVALERDSAMWVMAPERGIAYRDGPPRSSAEIHTCAPCHSRRSKLARHVPGRPFLDAFRPELVEEGMYLADGQMDGEVYTWGSFVQSRMFHAGVSCSDCHDPHSGKLRAAGNAVCGKCHAPAKFDTAAHHHHKPGSAGAGCVECHMPVRTYMVVDPRHDHSFRVPRPDLTAALGVPNTCNGCHAERTAEWAATAIAAWNPGKPLRAHFGAAIAKGRRLAAGTRGALLALLNDAEQPAIARATALGLVPAFASEDLVEAVRKARADSSALIRSGAAVAALQVPVEQRVDLVKPLLGDESRLVRIDAARALATARARLDSEVAARVDIGLEEFKEAQRINADQPQAHVALGTLYADLGRAAEAEKAYRTALDLAPYFLPAYVNLADLYRSQRRDDDAEAVLRQGLKKAPDDAGLHHSLGLTLVRRGKTAEALAELQRAAAAAPANARFAYVYAVALNSVGRRDEALKVLKASSAEHPAEPDLLIALATMSRDAGNATEALRYAEQLVREWPSSTGARQLLQTLRPPAP